MCWNVQRFIHSFIHSFIQTNDVILRNLLLQDALGAMLSWSFSATSAEMNTCWLVITLSELPESTSIMELQHDQE